MVPSWDPATYRCHWSFGENRGFLRTVPQDHMERFAMSRVRGLWFSPLSVPIMQDPSSYLFLHFFQGSLRALWLWSSLPGDHVPHCLGPLSTQLWTEREDTELPHHTVPSPHSTPAAAAAPSATLGNRIRRDVDRIRPVPFVGSLQNALEFTRTFPCAVPTSTAKKVWILSSFGGP